MDPQRTSTDPLIGRVLGERYALEDRLGEGGMGVVYRARHVVVGRPFAVKVLHERALQDDKVARRFAREAELAGRLRHPNLVGVVDVGDVDHRRYMVMELAEGPDLAALLEEAPMRPDRIIRLVRQMLEGLYHAHELGLIHRDLKPENVIVERDTHGEEVVRIVDFGIALLSGADAGAGDGARDSRDRLTTGGLVLGTPHYMAPEQAVADPIDHRIDLFALGIVVYEMLSGRLPFDGRGAEVARANLLLDPPPISQRVEHLEVDPLLEAFARRLMAKQRGDRPASAKVARELLDLIERDRVAAAAALGLPITASNRAGPTEQLPAIDLSLGPVLGPSSDPSLDSSLGPSPGGAGGPSTDASIGAAGGGVDHTARMRPTPRGRAPEAAAGTPGVAASGMSLPGAADAAAAAVLPEGSRRSRAAQAGRVAPALAAGAPVALPSRLPRPPDSAPRSTTEEAEALDEPRPSRVRWWIGGGALAATAAIAAVILLRGGAGDLGREIAGTAGDRSASAAPAAPGASAEPAGRAAKFSEEPAPPLAPAEPLDRGRAAPAAVAERDPSPAADPAPPVAPARPPAGSGNRVSEHTRSPRGTAIPAADRAVTATAGTRGPEIAPRDRNSLDRDAHRGSSPSIAGRAPAVSDSSPAGLRALFETAWTDVGKLPRSDGDDLTARLLRFQISQAMQAAPDERAHAAAQLLEIVQEARRRRRTSAP